MIGFRIDLPANYPLNAPWISCCTISSFPSISDGRDLLSEILLCDWSPIVSLYEIITKIPAFLAKYSLNSQIGKFHLCIPIDTNIWQNNFDIGSFSCLEIDLITNNTHERLIIITHSVLLILQIYPFYINIGHIVFYKGLEFIETIRIHTSDSEIVAIEWKDRIGQFQIFRVYNAENMVRLIKQNSNLLQIMNCSHNDETCEKKLKDIEIYEIIKKILECENRLTFDLNTDIIKDIINCCWRLKV